MKKIIFIFVITFLAGQCDGQGRFEGLHRRGTIAMNETVRSSLYSGLILQELFDRNEKAVLPEEKADIYFWISKFYAEKLKIDSALYYSGKIGDLDARNKSDIITAKSQLARIYALFFRSQDDRSISTDRLKQILSAHKEYLLLGLLHRLIGKKTTKPDALESIQNFHIAIGYFLKGNSKNELQRTYFEIGRNYYIVHNTDSAAFYFTKALRLAEEIKSPVKMFMANGYLGELNLAVGNLDNAIEYFQAALAIDPTIVSKIERRNRLMSFVSCYVERNDLVKASSIVKEIEKANAGIGDLWGNLMLNKIKGEIEYTRKNYSDAVLLLQSAFDGLVANKMSEYDIAHTSFQLGVTKYELGNYGAAIQDINYSLLTTKTFQLQNTVLDANLFLSKCYDKKGNIDSAYYYYRVYSLQKDSLITAEKDKNIAELNTRYETDKKEQTIKLLQQSEELSSYHLRLQREQLVQQDLLGKNKSHQLDLLMQQNEIDRLETSQKELLLTNKQNELSQNQKETDLLLQEKDLQQSEAARQKQRKQMAYGGIIALVIAGAFVFYRYKKQKKLQHQQALLSERLRISRELHDEVGATLSGIAMYSHLTKEQMKMGQLTNMATSLNIMQQSSGEMVNKLNDIVWLINPEQDSLQQLVNRLEEYATNMAAIKNIKIKISVPEKITAINLPVESRRNIYLFCKEAINNAVKYSNAAEMELLVKEQDRKIVFIVRDNGQGFDTVMVRRGNGLENMKKRADEIGARFSLQTKINEGVSVSFECTIT